MTVLLVMAKAPVPGRAKTRLCPPATPVQAATLAAAALLDTLGAVRATPGCTPMLAYAGDLTAAVRGGDIAAALAGWHLVEQRGDGLADRLAHAHRAAAQAFPGRPVLQIGMDTPQLTAGVLAEAAGALGDAECVLGPATDGGWWALGLRDPRQAAALRGVPMSTAATGALTATALQAAGLVVAPLRTMSDVDDWPAARAMAATAPGSRFAAALAQVVAG